VVETANKIRVEELYHLRHTSAWVRRLGLGTTESQQRMRAALDLPWRYTPQLFTLTSNSVILSNLGINLEGAYSAWHEMVVSFLIENELKVPNQNDPPINRSDHTDHLGVLVRRCNRSPVLTRRRSGKI